MAAGLYEILGHRLRGGLVVTKYEHADPDLDTGPVEVVEADPILEGLGPSPVFLEVHYCEVKELPAGFQLLASSRDCPIQVMKRLDKPVYGTQFHPEGYTEAPHDRRNSLVNLVYPGGFPEACADGRGLLANFFRIAAILDRA